MAEIFILLILRNPVNPVHCLHFMKNPGWTMGAIKYFHSSFPVRHVKMLVF